MGVWKCVGTAGLSRQASTSALDADGARSLVAGFRGAVGLRGAVPLQRGGGVGAPRVRLRRRGEGPYRVALVHVHMELNGGDPAGSRGTIAWLCALSSLTGGP